MEHGAIDMIVHRTEMRDTIASLLSKLTNQTLDPVEPQLPSSEQDADEAVVAPEGDE